MTCSQCGSSVPEGADFCAKCGARTAGYARPAEMPPPAAAGVGNRTSVAQAYRFDYRRLTLSDQIAGAASLVVLISLFLPWFSLNLGGLSSELGVSPGVVTASGTAAHGWLWFVFIIGIVILLYLAVTAGFEVLPVKLPVQHEWLLLAATGINFLLILLAFVLKPGGVGGPVGWTFGAILGLIAAIVAVAPLARDARQHAAVGKSQ
jgi:zinc ribbon protein